MPDVTSLILDDHETFRRSFAALDTERGADAADLLARWEPLADLLDLHAAAEEAVFYPALLAKADPDGEETEDAIGDHNDIRDAVQAARSATPGSDAWWRAVDAAREANSEHMAEEEREGLADFRRNAAQELNDRLGEEFARYKAAHPGGRGADTADKDPEGYVEAHS